MKTFKQKKYSNLINKYFNQLFVLEKNNKFKNIIITVIYVYINKILSYSKIYINVYPNHYNNKIINYLNKKKAIYKKKLSIFLKNKFKIPDIKFCLPNDHIFSIVNFIK